MEIWKDIPGYEGFYQASNYGRVKGIARTFVTKDNRNRVIRDRIVKGHIDDLGYRRMSLSKDNKKTLIRTHALVASAFISKPDYKCEVNHKDGNRVNNNLSNLEWCTHQQNLQHAHDNGMVNTSRGESHRCAKLNSNQVLQIRARIGKGKSHSQLAGEYGVTKATISAIASNRSWKHLKAA